MNARTSQSARLAACIVHMTVAHCQRLAYKYLATCYALAIMSSHIHCISYGLFRLVTGMDQHTAVPGPHNTIANNYHVSSMSSRYCWPVLLANNRTQPLQTPLAIDVPKEPDLSADTGSLDPHDVLHEDSDLPNERSHWRGRKAPRLARDSI